MSSKKKLLFFGYQQLSCLAVQDQKEQKFLKYAERRLVCLLVIQFQASPQNIPVI